MCLHVGLDSHVPVMVAPSLFTIPVEVSIRNSADHPVTFLKWATPFDPLAGLLGVFTVHDTEREVAVPVDTVKIARKLPATREDLIEIPAGEVLKVTVKIPRICLKASHEYLLHVEGVWLAIWEKTLGEVTEGQLMDLRDSKRGEFKSDTRIWKTR